MAVKFFCADKFLNPFAFSRGPERSLKSFFLKSQGALKLARATRAGKKRQGRQPGLAGEIRAAPCSPVPGLFLGRLWLSVLAASGLFACAILAHCPVMLGKVSGKDMALAVGAGYKIDVGVFFGIDGRLQAFYPE